MGAGESNLGLLKEQLVFLTNEPSLHPLLVLIFFSTSWILFIHLLEYLCGFMCHSADVAVR